MTRVCMSRATPTTRAKQGHMEKVVCMVVIPITTHTSLLAGHD